jgi:nicotinamidase-related amidase
MEKVAKTLVVIDMQYDFIDGSLGSKDAEAIVPAVREKIESCRKEGYRIIFTRDTHHAGYLSTREGSYLPVEHCIEGTHGWEISSVLDTDGAVIIDKPAFGFTGWSEYPSDVFEVIGLCTDICVVSNALILKAVYPEAVVRVDRRCCAGVTRESHEAALATMKACQVEVY